MSSVVETSENRSFGSFHSLKMTKRALPGMTKEYLLKMTKRNSSGMTKENSPKMTGKTSVEYDRRNSEFIDKIRYYGKNT